MNGQRPTEDTIINGLSFDIEDWFQVENLKGSISCNDWECCDMRVINNTRKILGLLQVRQTRATFFILGWIADRCPDLVKEIAAAGHEVASHGYSHELVYKQSPKAFEEDLRKSKTVLEAMTGQHIFGYRAPSFSITPESEWAIGILKDLGFQYDSSVFPTSFHNRYGFSGSSRIPFAFDNGLIELPLSTLRVAGKNVPVAGGGYFRLYPYALFRYLCKRLNGSGHGLIFYLHPWELDPGQPRVKELRLNHRIRHYINLDKTEKRLKRLLNDFRFAPLIELATKVNKQGDRLRLEGRSA